MNQNTSEPTVAYEWVMTRFIGPQAKFVSTQATQSVGYYILERPEKGEGWIVAAYRRTLSPPEGHIQQIRDPKLIDKLEKWANPAKYREVR